MKTIKGFWQHRNGDVYAIESTTFGKIVGAAGPLDPDDLHRLEDYDYKPAIINWLEEAIAKNRLRKINPL